MVSDNPVSATPFQQAGEPTPYASPPLCLISGVVARVDGSPCPYATVNFNARVPQVLNGVAVQPTLVSSSTDGSGNLQAISLPQGLLATVNISYGGVTYPTSTVQVPAAATATFSQLFTWGGG